MKKDATTDIRNLMARKNKREATKLPSRLLVEEMTIESGGVKLVLQDSRDANKKYYTYLNKAAVLRIKEGV